MPLRIVLVSSTRGHHAAVPAQAATPEYREAVAGRFSKGTRIKVLVRNEKGEAVLDFKGTRRA
jgi:hypothetical protein